MRRRKKILPILISTLIVFVFNILWHLIEFRYPLLLYVACVNSIILGYFIGGFINLFLDEENRFKKSFYCGLIVGMFGLPLWENYEISSEFYANNITLDNPLIDYFRFYIVGFIVGSVKAFYYTIVPLLIISSIVGLILEKIKQ